jgi:hypothetical protein
MWAEKLAKSIGLVKQTNSQIVTVLKSDSEVLARIQDSFHTMIRARDQDGFPPIQITCFFEELPLLGVGVVSRAIFLYILTLINVGCSITLSYTAGVYPNRYPQEPYGHDQV